MDHLRCRSCFLAVVFFGQLAALRAQQVESPLAVTPDAIGQELQKTFIGAGDPADGTRGSFTAYRKSFQLTSPPRDAQLHLFADARYLIWLNGRPLHRGPNRFETPGPEYDTVDITRELLPGANSLAILVMGNDGDIEAVKDGMGNGHNARMMKHASGLTLRLDVDGVPVLKTDDTWKWSDQTRYRPAKINWADIIDRIDARVEDGDWTLPAYEDKAWRTSMKMDGSIWGPLSRRRIPLLRDTAVPASFSNDQALPVTLTAGKQLPFSMGRLVQAYTVLTIDADEGTELSLDYAGIDYIAKDGRQTYISSDSHAFDGGTITVKSGRATILEMKWMERLYPFDRVGSFHSSDPLLNNLWNVCARSLQILSEDAYIDCADRERAEWMDCDPPMFDVTRTAMATTGGDGSLHYADARLLGEMLRRTALTVQPDGWTKAHTCSDRMDIHAKMEDRSCDWVQGARRYYDSTGDRKLIREIWPVIVRQMDYFLTRRTSRGLVLAREWVVWGNPVGYVTCEGAGLNAFVYKALSDAAYLGNIIGENQQATRLAKEASALAAAFNTVLWDEKTGAYFSGCYSAEDRAKATGTARKMSLSVDNDLIEPTMFSSLWALDQKIVPSQRLARVRDYVLGNRAQAERTMTFYYLFLQMYEADTAALDREVLNTIRSKWAPQAESAWGTTWEDLDGSSKAHCYGMFPGYFMSAHVLGVRIEGTVADRRILIEPRLGDLTSAEGTVVTEYGPVPVSWKQEKDALHFRVEIPAHVTATLRVPKTSATSHLALSGNSTSGRDKGRYLEVTLASGSYEGSVK